MQRARSSGGSGDEENRREVPILLVLKRFREGAISSGKAARILAISRREFLDRLAREGIPVYNPTDEELTQELETVQSLTCHQNAESGRLTVKSQTSQ